MRSKKIKKKVKLTMEIFTCDPLIISIIVKNNGLQTQLHTTFFFSEQMQKKKKQTNTHEDP